MNAKFKLRLLLAALVALSAGQITQGRAAENKTEVEAGATYDHLNNDTSDWTGLYFEGVHVLGEHKKLYGSLERTTRYDISDIEAAVGGYYPLAESTVGVLEGRVAAPGDIFPKSTLFAKVEQLLGKGWVLQGGWKHQSFRDASVDLGILTVERYFSSLRAGYTMHVSLLDGSHSSVSHIGAFSSYYGKRNSLTVIGSKGREIESVPPPASAPDIPHRVASFQTYSLSFWGRHWISPHWGLTYSVSYREQGDLYDVLGVRGGIRYGF